MAKRTDIPVTSGKQERDSSTVVQPLVELEKVFDRMVNRDWSSFWHRRDHPAFFEFEGRRVPNLDVIDRDDEILVRAELPGLEKKDIDIALDGSLLTIKAQRKDEDKVEKDDFYRHEITCSSFARSITLPTAVDSTKAEAVLKDGMLEIRLPKTQTTHRQKIEVH